MGNLQVKSRCGPGVRGGCLEVLEIRRRRSVSDQRSGGGEREAVQIKMDWILQFIFESCPDVLPLNRTGSGSF